MGRLRYMTAGESHGQALVGIMDGMVAGLAIDPEAIRADLRRRQQGYGRGGRMKIEQDEAEFLTGVRFGETLGSPIALLIRNRDFENWRERMAPFGDRQGEPFTRPRPGHADLVGVLKYERDDARDILERASARETAMRVALGAVAKQFLQAVGVAVGSHVVALGPVTAPPLAAAADLARSDDSPVRCLDSDAEKAMIAAIDEARLQGDTLGGVVEIVATGVPLGLGSHTQWDRRMDGRLGQALMAVPAMKGVEIGDGFWASGQGGSNVHDQIHYNDESGFYRETNRAGGIEGGMTNGEWVRVRMAMKPLSSLGKPLASVDIKTKEAFKAQVERSDITAVPAAGIVGEAVMSLVLADAILETFGGDSLRQVCAAIEDRRSRASR